MNRLRALRSLGRWVSLIVVVAVMAMLAVIWRFRSHFTNDLAHLFPKDSVSGNFYRTIQEARLTQSIQLELSCGKKLSRTELHPILDKIATQISVLPEIASATASFHQETGNLLDELLSIVPCTTSPEILDKADPATAVASARKALAMPGVPIEFLRKDPLGLRLAPLEKLQEFRALFGLKADTSDGYLILEEKEGWRALILVNTNFAKAPSADAISGLFVDLYSIVREHLPQASLSIISPLQHNLANEKNVRRDILTVSIASFAILFLLFVIVYKCAWDALLIPLMPLAATILVTGIMAMFVQNLCLFIVGIGGGIAGLAVDQGIHIYAACAGKDRFQKIQHLLSPLLMSVLTSAAVFLLVAGTGITAYVQLGVFAALTLLFNLLLSLAVLPVLVRRRENTFLNKLGSTPSPPKRWVDWAVCGIWLGVVIASVFFTLSHLKIDLSIRALDGTPATVLQEEEEFQKRWFQPDAGTPLVLVAPNPDAALRQCEELATLPALQTAPLFHCASLWPSQEIRRKNLAAWRSPAIREKLLSLQKHFQEECAAAHLPPKFFDVGFTQLFATLDASEEPSPPPFLQTISRHFLRDYGSSTTALLLSGIPRNQHSSELLDALHAYPNAALVTSEAFQQAAIHDLWPRIRRILWLLIPLLLVAMSPLLKHPMQLLIVALPGATALLIGGVPFAAADVPLNLVSLLAILMLSGLVLDYGIFALAIAKSKQPNSMVASLGMSAVTTQLTTAVMMFSDHPVMKYTGAMFYLCIVLTALVALWVVPALIRCFVPKRLLPLLLLLLCVSGCMSSLSPHGKITPLPQPETVESFFRHTGKPSVRLYTMKTSYLWVDFTMLLAVSIENGKMKAVGTAVNGSTIFSMKGSQTTVSSAIPPIAQRKIFANLPKDLRRVFFLPGEMSSALKITYGGKPLHYLEQKVGIFPFRSWQAVYYNWDGETGSFGTIQYRNYETRVTLTLKQKP